MRNLFGDGTYSHEQSTISLTAFGEFLRNNLPRLILNDFCKVLGSVCCSLLLLSLWVAKVIIAFSVWYKSVSRSLRCSFPCRCSLFLAYSLQTLHSPGNPFQVRFLLVWTAVSNCHSYQGYFLATVSCNVLCDALITFGMVYTLFRNRTQVRRCVGARHCKNAITLFTPGLWLEQTTC